MQRDEGHNLSSGLSEVKSPQLLTNSQTSEALKTCVHEYGLAQGIFNNTSAWKEETEKMPSRPMASLVGREAKPSRRLGLGGSPPCRLAR